MKIITLLAVLLCQLSFSQNYYSGHIIRKKENSSLEYVNIGIINKNIGTVSDINGFYKLKILPEYYNDSICFSAIGYRSIVLKVEDFLKSKSDTTVMEEILYSLNEVEIKYNKLKIKRKGDRLRYGIAGSYGVDQLGHELGIKINIDKSPAFLKDFNFFIAQNYCDTLLFRINVYIVNDSFPSENILKENIFVKTAIKKGFVNVNLENYNIYVNQDFVITIEWLNNYEKDCIYFRFRPGFSTTPVFSKVTSQGNWQIFNYGIEFNVNIIQ